MHIAPGLHRLLRLHLLRLRLRLRLAQREAAVVGRAGRDPMVGPATIKGVGRKVGLALPFSAGQAARQLRLLRGEEAPWLQLPLRMVQGGHVGRGVVSF